MLQVSPFLLARKERVETIDVSLLLRVKAYLIV